MPPFACYPIPTKSLQIGHFGTISRKGLALCKTVLQNRERYCAFENGVRRFPETSYIWANAPAVFRKRATPGPTPQPFSGNERHLGQRHRRFPETSCTWANATTVFRKRDSRGPTRPQFCEHVASPIEDVRYYANVFR